jgi:anti-anti-sigma factor
MRGKVTTTSFDGIPVVSASGDLDLVMAPQLREALHSAIRDHAALIMDLREASYIESAGLGAILGAKMRLTQKGGHIALVTAPGHVHNMVCLTRLEQAMPVRTSLEDAARALRGETGASAAPA